MKKLNEFKLIRPSTAGVSQLFRQNKVSFYKQLGMKGHNGIDYVNKVGDPIIAPCDLEVTGTENTGYGMTLWAKTKQSVFDADREYKLEMVFGHLSGFIERKEAKMGFTIARTGNTGKYSTGAHLHFGVRPVYRVKGKGWKVFNYNNGYFGYLDPADFWVKTYKDMKPMFAQDWATQTIYQLGVDGFWHIHSDAQLFQRLYGKFTAMNIPKLKSELYQPGKMTIASQSKFLRIFKNVWKK
jgi:murein DD-endopeptidase MepM/ murein hydrolase activator NlpD